MKKRLCLFCVVGLVISTCFTGCFLDPKVKEVPEVDTTTGVITIDSSLAETTTTEGDLDHGQDPRGMSIVVSSADGLVDVSIPSEYFAARQVEQIFPFLVAEEIMRINDANGTVTFRMTTEDYTSIQKSNKEDMEVQFEALQNYQEVTSVEWSDESFHGVKLTIEGDTISDELNKTLFEVMNSAFYCQVMQGGSEDNIFFQISYMKMTDTGEKQTQEKYGLADWLNFT